MARQQRNPLDTFRRRTILACVVAAPALAASTWWAVQPPHIAPPPIEPSTSQVRPSIPRAPKPDSPSFDPNTFAINLWNPPAPPPAPAPADDQHARAPTPLNVQLIGIITEGTGETAIYRAALYDVEQDRLLIVADGEQLRDRIVRILPGGLVELGHGNAKQRLLLRPDKEAS